nr:DNA polymerase-like [Tanacetum cinerariifolium]
MIEKDMIIHTYYSEEYKVILDSFEERSRKVMIDLISMIERLVKQEKKSKTVYFHNFSRFDGFFLLKHLAFHHPKYKIKPLMRNNRLYELSVYSGSVDHESVNEKRLEKEKRKAYYGGHTDSYKPYGENLYYDKTWTLIEELKYAVGLGYKVVPILGYLFERKEGPFKDFVRFLFLSRLEARKEENDALSYVQLTTDRSTTELLRNNGLKQADSRSLDQLMTEQKRVRHPHIHLEKGATKAETLPAKNKRPTSHPKS